MSAERMERYLTRLEKLPEQELGTLAGPGVCGTEPRMDAEASGE